MNLTNELDLALDEAIKRRLGAIYDKYFQSGRAGEADAKQLQDDIKQLETSVEAATKALEEML